MKANAMVLWWLIREPQAPDNNREEWYIQTEDFFDEQPGRARIYEYYGKGGKVDILTGIEGLKITHIGGDALAICTGLTSVIIPENATEIWNHIFDGYTGFWLEWFIIVINTSYRDAVVSPRAPSVVLRWRHGGIFFLCDCLLLTDMYCYNFFLSKQVKARN